MRANWHAVSRARPRRCAADISRTVAARDAIGWLATSTTRRAARCSCASPDLNQGKARPANGPTPRPATWPAMIAAVTDLDARITGAHRTWLDPAGFDPVRLGKAPIDSPRRAMGHLLGNAVRFGTASDVVAAGEGIETILSLRCVMP